MASTIIIIISSHFSAPLFGLNTYRYPRLHPAAALPRNHRAPTDDRICCRVGLCVRVPWLAELARKC
uniref:Putative secreted peptide n=1 Tax=Anopheles braziliensis TaxID=58242 RepID=A0A2M3ZVT7_9DIPT